MDNALVDMGKAEDALMREIGETHKRRLMLVEAS